MDAGDARIAASRAAAVVARASGEDRAEEDLTNAAASTCLAVAEPELAADDDDDEADDAPTIPVHPDPRRDRSAPASTVDQRQRVRQPPANAAAMGIALLSRADAHYQESTDGGKARSTRRMARLEWNAANQFPWQIAVRPFFFFFFF